MKRALSILLLMLLCGCSQPGKSPKSTVLSPQPGPPMPTGWKSSALPQLVILPPVTGITASVSPPTAFVLSNSTSLMQPMVALTNGNGSVFIPGSMLPTNQPVYSQSLAWDPVTDLNVAGVTVYYSTNSGLLYASRKSLPRNRFGIRTNITLNLPSGGTWYYALTSYNALFESAMSDEVTGIPEQVQQIVSWFFRADVTNKLTVK